jgi:uncharacterized membrane protein YebE (DUF533 family)
MSLKKTAMRMALAFAAAKGYQAFRKGGGMAGLKDRLAGAGGSSTTTAGSSSSGGLGGLLGSLGGGTTGAGSSGGLGGILSSLGGATGTARSGGMGGLLGGLAAMAGGSAIAQGSDADVMRRAEQGPQDEATAAAMIRAIGQAVRADGEIDAGERQALDDIMGDTDTPEDQQAIRDALSEPLNPEALARDVPRGHEAEVYAAALTAIDPDASSERAYLQRFATALALDPQEIERLHAAAGKQA